MKNGLIPFIEQHTYIFQLGLQILILITTHFRIIGKEKISVENWNKIYINRDEELSEIVEMIKDLNNRGVDVYLYVNNHYEGCAPVTIEKVEKLFNDYL